MSGPKELGRAGHFAAWLHAERGEVEIVRVADGKVRSFAIPRSDVAALHSVLSMAHAALSGAEMAREEPQ